MKYKDILKALSYLSEFPVVSHVMTLCAIFLENFRRCSTEQSFQNVN